MLKHWEAAGNYSGDSTASIPALIMLVVLFFPDMKTSFGSLQYNENAVFESVIFR